jgi:hypothetical protein
MKIRTIKKFVAPFLLLGILAGCATEKIKDHVEIIGDSMGDVEIKDLRSMRINDLLMAQGSFFNTGKKPVQGYYRCKFLDTQDFQVGEDQTWQLLTIYPNQTQKFKCQSTHLEATNFKIEFSNNAKNVTVYH